MTKYTLPIKWAEDRIILLDQTALPTHETYIEIITVEQMWDAIKKLKVRGAPAIGIAASYGVCLAMQKFIGETKEIYHDELQKTIKYLASSRPTAVNLFWALERMSKVGARMKDSENEKVQAALLQEAQAIDNDEEVSCVKIGESFLSFLKDGMSLLTHCNAGGIATRRYGTALAPMLLGKERGINFKVYADETRPLLQGARLTTWELMKAEIDVTLITDSMAGMVMQQGKIDAVIVGCDRIAANGDTVNKIGTYSVAVLAKHHNIPFYVAAPISTIDVATKTGNEIVIEERNSEEITNGFGKQTAPDGVKTYNPAFDMTPADLITAIVTDEGIIYPPYSESIQKLLEAKEVREEKKE